jgi:hypothetical protein
MRLCAPWAQELASLAPPTVLWRFEGGSEMSDQSAQRSLRCLSSSNPPEPPGAEALLAAPLPLSKGLGATPTSWGPLVGTSEIRILRWGSRPPVWRTAMSLSSRVGSMAKIVVLSPKSS